MTTSRSSGPARPGAGPREDDRRQQSDSGLPTDEVVAEADEESFPASDAPGWIPQTTIGPPGRERVANTDPASLLASGGGISPESHCRRDSSEEEANDGTAGSVE